MPDEAQNEQVVVEEKQPEELLTSNETSKEPELPEEVSERTREQFEKLKQHNKELAEKLRQKEEQNIPESVYEDLKPKAVQPTNFNPAIPQNELDKLMDEQGYIDPVLLKTTLANSQAQAQQALAEAKRIREEFENARETEQVKKAHKDFPMLDPKRTDFNQKFFDAVKNEMVSQMLRGEKDLVAAAHKVAEWFPVSTPKKEEAEKKELQAKQANLTGTTQSRPQTQNTDNSDLVRRMWKGDRNALLERLKNAGY